MKESYYFPHDFDPTGDPKMQALIGEYGATGYGIYWRIVEMLHTDCNHKLPLKQYIYLAIAKQMLTSVEQTQAIINYAINICELFVSDSDYFWSNRVNSNFDKRSEISEKRSIAGRAGAIAKQNLANASKGKEKKVKEIKVNNKNTYGLNSNIFLTENEFERLKKEFPDKYQFAIDYLSNYKIEKKYKTENDNLTIRRWVIEAVSKSIISVKSTFTPSPR